MADNREFAKQIGAAVIELGTEEALKGMSRMMCAIAAAQGEGPVQIRFECDQGLVEVTTKQLKLQS
ncbi:hypothetical protein ACV1DG_24035 [Aeromonas hydrophila]|nr:hypothetical protein [Klebsiella pneumoniae]HCG2948057.1 hypothetical protein [Klebsiella pneumoniae]